MAQNPCYSHLNDYLQIVTVPDRQVYLQGITTPDIYSTRQAVTEPVTSPDSQYKLINGAQVIWQRNHRKLYIHVYFAGKFEKPVCCTKYFVDQSCNRNDLAYSTAQYRDDHHLVIYYYYDMHTTRIMS